MHSDNLQNWILWRDKLFCDFWLFFTITIALNANSLTFPWLFPKFIFSLTFNKIPWLFPDFCQVWNFPDFSLTAGHPAVLDLRPHKCFWNGAQINIRLLLWYTFGCCTIIGSIYFDMMEIVHKAFYFFRKILYFLQFRSIQFIYKMNTYCYASKLF